MHKSRSYGQFCPYRNLSKEFDDDNTDITSYSPIPIRSDSSELFHSFNTCRVSYDETINQIFDHLYSVENVSFSPEELEDPFLFINKRFQQIYKQTKRVTLTDKILKSVIVAEGDKLIFFTEGARSKSSNIITDTYTNLKTVAHIAFCLYLIVDPFTQKRTKQFPLEELKAYGPLIYDSLNIQMTNNKWFENELLPTQEIIVDLCLKFYHKLIENNNCTREELIDFCKQCTPYLKENIKNAAISEINELHKEVQEYKASLTKEQWDAVVVVITGPHMARKGYLVTQYFARLLQVDVDEDQRLIFAEGTFEEEGALDLLATNATDTEASEAFFGDGMFMHSDVLASSTEEYLDELFEKAQSLYVSVAQALIMPADKVGQMRRMRSAIKDAASGGADVVCFPATINSGIRDATFAETIPGPTFDYLAEKAKEFKIFVIAGILEKTASGEIIPTAVMVDDSGNLILKHQPGDSTHCVTTRLGKIAVLDYSDTTNPEILKKVASEKPDIVFIPLGELVPTSQWPLPADKTVASIAKVAAKNLNCAAVAVTGISESLFRQWTANVDGSSSVIVSGAGEILLMARQCERQLKFVKVLLGSHIRHSAQKWNKLKSLLKEKKKNEYDATELQQSNNNNLEKPEPTATILINEGEPEKPKFWQKKEKETDVWSLPTPSPESAKKQQEQKKK